MFVKFLIAAIALPALLVRADPNPTIPGGYMLPSPTPWQPRADFDSFLDAQAPVILTRREETVQSNGVPILQENGPT